VISVAALTSAGELSGFSNYGQTTVDLAAPGSSMYSTLPGGRYGTLSGTSMATPHVTGAVALYASTHQTATAAEIRAALLESVTPTASLQGLVATGGRLDVGRLMGTDPGTTDLQDVTDAIAGNITTSETLAADQTRASEIDFAGDQDWYRVELTAGYTYQIDLGANVDSPLDAYLRVLDASGNELGNNDNTIGTNARLSVQVLTGGTYFLSAGGQGTSTGAYTITLGAARQVSALHIAAVAPDGVREGNAGSTKVRFLVTRTGNTSQETTATWTVGGYGGNSADAADFTDAALPTGVVHFRPGETSKYVVLTVAGDTTYEPDETFTVSLSNASWGSMVGSGQAVGTILNDESLLSIAATTAVQAEGNAGSTPFTFTVTRTGNTSSVARVDWSVAGTGENAASARDFAGNRLPGGSVIFRKGETSRTITFQAKGDRAVEADEDFVVTLSNPTAGSSLGTASANGTILDDDGIVLSSTIGAGSALSSTTMTFIAPALAEAATASGLPLATPGASPVPALIVESVTVLMGALLEVRATVDTTTPAVHGGMADDLHQGIVLAMTRVDGLG
jgi:hypothetical protein